MYSDKCEVPSSSLSSKEFPRFTTQETSLLNNHNILPRDGLKGNNQLFSLVNTNNNSISKEKTMTPTFPSSSWSLNSPHSTTAISQMGSNNTQLKDPVPLIPFERQSNSEYTLSTIRTPSRTINHSNSVPSSGGSRSSQGSIKKRGRLETADPDIILNSDDYSRSKRIVHEGFRALKLSDQSNNYNSSSSTSLSMMDSLFETTNTGSARQRSNNSTPDSAGSKNFPPASAPPLPSYLNNHQGGSLRKISSVESDYSAQSEGTHSTGNQHSGLYDSDDSTVVSNSNPDPYSHHQQRQYSRQSRKRSSSSSYRHRKVPCLAKRNHGSRKSSPKRDEKDEERSSSPVDRQDLERELYHILKNGKRQYMNRVDYYVDELIRKSRRKEMNDYLEQRLSQPSSSSLSPPSSSSSSLNYSAELMKSLNDYYVDEGFINAVIGPQPTTDHAISLIVPPPPLLPPSSSSSSKQGNNISDNINSFYPFQSRENLDQMDFDDDVTKDNGIKPIRKKGDVTHSDWEIEEILDPTSSSSANNKSSDATIHPATNPDTIVNIDDLTDANQATITDPQRQQYYQTFASFLQKRLQDLDQRGGSGSSIRSTSGDYGHGNTSMSNTCSLGDMSDGGNDSDMACCDDWSQNSSSNNQSEDEEDLDLVSSNGGDMKNSVNGGSRKSSIGSVNSSIDGRRRDMKFIFSSNDLLTIRQQELQKFQQHHHRQFSRSSSSPPILASLHDVTVSDAVDSRYRSDERSNNGFNDSQLMIDDTSDDESMHRHLENDTFPTQQNHMRFFEQSQRDVKKGSEEKESGGGSASSSSSVLQRRKELLNVYTPLFHSVSDDETEDVINVGVF